VIHETFDAAFASVKNVLKKKLTVSYGLLTELLSRGALTQSQIYTIKACPCCFSIMSICISMNGCKL